MPDKLIFSPSRASSGPKLDEPTVAALKALRVVPQEELKPAYPLAVFHAVVKLLAERL